MCSGTYSPTCSDASQRFAGGHTHEGPPSPHPVSATAGSPFVLERTLPDPGIPTHTISGRGGAGDTWRGSDPVYAAHRRARPDRVCPILPMPLKEMSGRRIGEEGTPQLRNSWCYRSRRTTAASLIFCDGYKFGFAGG